MKHKLMILGAHDYRDVYTIEQHLINYCTPYNLKPDDLHILTGDNWGAEMVARMLAEKYEMEATVYKRDTEFPSKKKEKARIDAMVEECDGLLAFMPTDRQASSIWYARRQMKLKGKHVVSIGVTVDYDNEYPRF